MVTGYFSIALVYHLSTGISICLNIVLHVNMCIMFATIQLISRLYLKIHYIAGWQIYKQVSIENTKTCLLFGAG